MTMRGIAAIASSAPWIATVIRPASSAPPNSEMSAPAAKIFSPPVITTAPGGDAPSSTPISWSRRTTPLESAFTLPFFSVTIATPSSLRSSVTSSSLIHSSCVEHTVQHAVGRCPGIGLVGCDRLGQLVPPIACADLASPLMEPIGNDLAQLLTGTERPSRRQLSALLGVLPVGVDRIPQRADTVIARRHGGHDRRSPAVVRQVREIEHLLEIAPCLGDSLAVGLVDREHVGDLHEAGLVGLHAVAPTRVHHDDRRVRLAGDLDFDLPHAD